MGNSSGSSGGNNNQGGKSGWEVDLKDSSNGTNYFYNMGYMAGSADYDPSMGETVGQGADALMAIGAGQQAAYSKGYSDGVRENNQLWACTFGGGKK